MWENASSQLYIEKLNSDINTSGYDEIGPVLSDDCKTLYFTRVADPKFDKTLIYANVDQKNLLSFVHYYRLLANIYSQIAGHRIYSPSESEFNQDIWIAKKKGNYFQEVIHPGFPLNDALPNSVCSIFPEENALIVVNQFNAKGGMKEGFSYIKMAEDGSFMPPVPLNIYKFYENGNSVNLCMSRDGEHLFLSLKRDDSVGDYDLYLCIRVAKNLWSNPFHLNIGINSPYMEGAPFISKDKKRLYFSSNRENPGGDSDIYVSQRLDYTYLNWSEPKKLPYPVNTEYDEAQPFVDLDEKYLYFTSNRDGSSDIFRVELKPGAKLDRALTINLKIINADNDLLTRGELRWGTASKQRFDDFFRTYTGVHTITVTKDELLKIQVKKRGYGVEEVIIDPGELVKKNITTKDINIYLHRRKKLEITKNHPLFNKEGIFTLQKIYFEQAKDLVLPSSYPQLEELAKVMRKNPGIYIRIEGYTDNLGDKHDLLNLSFDRANAIKRFLMKKRINPVRISTVGFGDERPLNDNTSESERKKNRRVEVRIIKS